MKNQNLFAALRAAFPAKLEAVAVETGREGGAATVGTGAAPDGATIEGLLYYPLDYVAGVRVPLSPRELALTELLMQKALERGLEAVIMDSPAYLRYAERRSADQGRG